MATRSRSDTDKATSFRDAYGILQRHAQTLRNQDEPNIDDLLTMVTESVQAYQVCRQRIDAVEAALKAALEGVEQESEINEPVSAPATAPAARPRSRPAPPPIEMDDLDDDVPF